MQRTKEDILDPVRKLQVFDRFATFPGSEKPGEYQSLIRWWAHGPSESSSSPLREVIGSGDTEANAAINALKLFRSHLESDIRLLERFLERVDVSVKKGVEL